MIVRSFLQISAVLLIVASPWSQGGGALAAAPPEERELPAIPEVLESPDNKADKTVPQEKPKGEDAQSGRIGDGKPGPETTADRDRILGDLYKRLAEADNADYAKLVETAIHKMWSFSGSDTVDLLMRRVEASLGKQKKNAAMSLLNAVVSLEPQYAEGWNRRAFLHFSNKDYGAALKDLRRVLIIDPKHYKAIGGLAVILREYGRDAAALKAFRKALEINPLDQEIVKAVNELEILVEGQEI